MNKEFFVWNLQLNDALTTTLTSKMIVIALAVAGICLIVSVAYNYLKNGFESLTGGDVSKFPDINEIARGIVMILIISMYLPVAKVTVGSIEAINQATSNSTKFTTLFSESINEFSKFQITSIEEMSAASVEEATKHGNISEQNAQRMKQNIESNKEDSGLFDSVTGAVKSMYQLINPATRIPLLFHTLCAFLFSIIKLLILGVCVIVVKVLIILGPFAFAFSILPVFRKQIEVWFSTLVTTGMVFTTLNVLDGIMGTALIHLVNPNASILQKHEMSLEVIALDIVMLILYCSSFWLTGKIVGKGDAGRVLSKLVGTAVAAAGLALGGGAVVAGSQAINTGTIQNAASAGRNIIEDGE